MRFSRTMAFSLFLAAAGLAVSGCAKEDYYCDDTGCFYCDGLGCRAVDPEYPPCESDADCPGGLCTESGCIETCVDDDECDPGFECAEHADDSTVTLCLPPGTTAPPLNPGPMPEACERNTDCETEGDVCRDGVCVPDDRSCGETGCDCSETGMCAEGFTCAEGECRPDEDTCHFSYECGEDRVCIDGACAAECDADRPCPEGQTCEDGICRDIPPVINECESSSHCDEGEICIDSSCRPACATDRDCGPGRICGEDGTCRVDDRPDHFCESDAECMRGHVCVDYACRTPCETHEDCLRFDVAFNFCSENLCRTTNEVTSNCGSSADCDDGDECIDGVCR